MFRENFNFSFFSFNAHKHSKQYNCTVHGWECILFFKCLLLIANNYELACWLNHVTREWKYVLRETINTSWFNTQMLFDVCNCMKWNPMSVIIFNQKIDTKNKTKTEHSTRHYRNTRPGKNIPKKQRFVCFQCLLSNLE